LAHFVRSKRTGRPPNFRNRKQAEHLRRARETLKEIVPFVPFLGGLVWATQGTAARSESDPVDCAVHVPIPDVADGGIREWKRSSTEKWLRNYHLGQE
jgi:hypothetical protein